MLEHAKTNPIDDLFQMAIFLGASLPFNVNNTKGLQQWLSAKSTDKGDSGEYSLSELSLGFPSSAWREAEGLLTRYHPQRDSKARIACPTIHVIGKLDEYASQAHTLTKLCRNGPVTIPHEAGHRVPRDAATTRKVIREIERQIAIVSLRH
jgi:pimeloyl-ACP methyl ester carboxylesterase